MCSIYETIDLEKQSVFTEPKLIKKWSGEKENYGLLGTDHS